jgi:hypothetical protein
VHEPPVKGVANFDGKDRTWEAEAFLAENIKLNLKNMM